MTNKPKNRRISPPKKQLKKGKYDYHREELFTRHSDYYVETSTLIDYGVLETALTQNNKSPNRLTAIESNVSELATKAGAADGANANTTAIISLEVQDHQTQSCGKERYEKSVENFIYILDGNLPISAKEKRRLRSLINFGLTSKRFK